MSSDSNNFSLTGKITSGTLLLIFTVLPIMSLIIFWPNLLPQSGAAYYKYNQFNIRLITDKNTEGLHINTVIFILVASSGFLGCMIHIATSFTTFIGAGKFDRNWILWYVVKPFSAAALAIVFYFVFRAGLLNINSVVEGNINLYGIMALSVFTGLFTDVATQKLKEVFSVLFRPKDDRPDKLINGISITSFMPEKLIIGETVQILIEGNGFNLNPIQLFMGSEKIKFFSQTDTQIKFKYVVGENDAHLIVFKIMNQDNTKVLYNNNIVVSNKSTPNE